jgi:hypothetical protein
LRARNLSAGRVATGGKVIAPWQADSGIAVASYLGVYADLRFSTDNAQPADQPLVASAMDGRGVLPAA